MRDFPYDVLRQRRLRQKLEDIRTWRRSQIATVHEFINLADLASARVGGRAIATNDDFFAPKSNLVKPEPAVSSPASTRRRASGWTAGSRAAAASPATTGASSQLGMRGIVHGVNVDTSHFTGNYPSHCSIEALDMPAALKPSLHATSRARRGRRCSRNRALRGNGDNFFAIADRRPWTHLRLSIYPDGGVARLRVYGEVAVDWTRVAPRRRVVDLASITNGGLFLDASDMHYGTKGALIMPGRAKNMGDGWETSGAAVPDTTGRSCGSARRVSSRRSRSTPITSRATIPIARRSRAVWRRGASLDALSRGGVVDDPAGDEVVGEQAAFLFRQAAAADRRGVARAAEHFPGRRRQPLAHPWHTRTRINNAPAGRRARDALARVRIARWVDRMMARRPFGSDARLLSAARTSGLA